MLRRKLFTLSVIRRRQSLTLALLVLIFALFSSALLNFPDGTGRAENSSAQKGTARAELNITAGLQRVIFTTPMGSTIYVVLPQDLAPGETHSGTVIADASGQTDAETAARNEEVGNYVIEIERQKLPATGRTFELKIPAAPPPHAIAVILRDKKGKEAARANFSVAPQAPSPVTSVRLPTYSTGMVGAFIEIDCPCDGVVADGDYLKVAGKNMLVLAESPRRRVAFNQSGGLGLQEIEFSERGEVTKGKMSLLGVKLSAEKQSLDRGEKTKLTVEVTGLEGLQEEIPLQLENRTTNTLTMQPANVQELTIKPADVQPGGRYVTERMLTGIQVGRFSINATVIRKDERAPVANNRVETKPAEFEVGLPLKSVRETEGQTFPAPPAPEIALVSPASGALVKEASRSTFSWKIAGLPAEAQGVVYTFRLVELQPEQQNLEEAIEKNTPVFEKRELKESSLRFPELITDRAGKVYAWRVTAYDASGTEISRSVPSFFALSAWPPWSFCFLVVPSTTLQYCIGQTLTAVASAVMSGSGVCTWTLSPPGGSGTASSALVAPIDLPPSVLPTTPGTYNYTLTVTRGTCTKSTPLTIIAYPPGAVGGSAVINSSSPAIICDGQTSQLDVQGESGTVGQWQYSDNSPTGPWLNATSAFNIAGAPVNTNQMFTSSCTAPNWYTDRWFRAVVSTSNDPNAPSCSKTYSTPTKLRIYCRPRAGAVSASTTRICKYSSTPSTITLQMSSPIIGDFDWYSSSSGLLALAGSHNQASFTVPAPMATTTYWAIVTTNGPCPSVTSNSVTVVVDTQPYCTSPTTALSANTTLVCPRDAAVLTLSGCTGNVTWQQATSAGGPWTTISAGNMVQNTTDLSQQTYWQAIISGPPGTSCPPVTSNVVVINIKPTPVAPFILTIPTACFGTNAFLTATPPPAGVTYQWYHDDIPLPCTTATCTFTAEPGNYWVEASNGCETVQSTIISLPVDIITIQFNPTPPCCGLGIPVQLTANASSSLSGPISPASFIWYEGNTQIGTGANVTVNPQNTTAYCVKVTSPSGCTSTACTTITVCH